MELNDPKQADSPKSGKNIYQVPADRDGQRLDNLLMRLNRTLAKSAIYKLIRKGQVRVNGSRCKPQTRVQSGDEVRLPPWFYDDQNQVRVSPEQVRRMADRIIYEDENYLAVDKPAGMAAHGGSGLNWGAVDLVKALKGDHLDLAHRLDRGTSGVLVFGKHRDALLAFQQASKGNTIEKKYLTLLAGRPMHQHWTVDAPLSKDKQGPEQRISVDEKNGKRAVTHFVELEHGFEWSFAEATLETGRTHQIRAHAAFMEMPIAGDEKYGDEAANKRFARAKLDRMFLHCGRMSWDYGDNKVLLHAPLPEELTAVLDRLQSRKR